MHTQYYAVRGRIFVLYLFTFQTFIKTGLENLQTLREDGMECVYGCVCVYGSFGVCVLFSPLLLVYALLP